MPIKVGHTVHCTLFSQELSKKTTSLYLFDLRLFETVAGSNMALVSSELGQGPGLGRILLPLLAGQVPLAQCVSGAGGGGHPVGVPLDGSPSWKHTARLQLACPRRSFQRISWNRPETRRLVQSAPVLSQGQRPGNCTTFAASWEMHREFPNL